MVRKKRKTILDRQYPTKQEKKRLGIVRASFRGKLKDVSLNRSNVNKFRRMFKLD